MTEKLAARLKTQPADAEGWAMLARSQTVLGRQAEALAAYERAVALRADDAQLWADYADALALRQNRQLSGEPLKLVEKALQLDPRNVKALYLAGTEAFNRKDYAGAVRYWERVQAAGAPDNPQVRQVSEALAEARSLAGLPASAPPAGQHAPRSALPGRSVAGTVTLAPALAQQVAPQDTVFIFARAAQGRGMPLAILRKQVKDLPVRFVLDDSLSMSPSALLSGASEVVVGARVSKSGNAMPQPGDLVGQSAAVPLGRADLAVEIRDRYKP